MNGRVAHARSEGQVTTVTGLFFLLLLVIVMATQIRLAAFRGAGIFAEDALAASVLASALIDIEEYGKTHMLRIASPQNSYTLFMELLPKNLNLNHNWESKNQQIVKGKIEVWEYIVYNVDGKRVMVSEFGKSEKETYEDARGVGSVQTPNGIQIESTSIYSRIGFWVTGLFETEFYAFKEVCVDVVTNQA
ncbi:MAG: hypothetical protein LBM69_07970 [Lachnospiraceae bacterium]|jgi:hypothetical protein|nr:hypothetical protein [Lachnospiraceae bacterium]